MQRPQGIDKGRFASIARCRGARLPRRGATRQGRGGVSRGRSWRILMPRTVAPWGPACLVQQRAKPRLSARVGAIDDIKASLRCGAVLAMRPQTPMGRINKDLRIHCHVEPTVCYPPTGKYKRMGFICLNDAELQILTKRGARNRLPLAHGSPLRNRRTMEPNRAGDLAIYQSVGRCHVQRFLMLVPPLAAERRWSNLGAPVPQSPAGICPTLGASNRGTGVRRARLRSAHSRSTESIRRLPSRSPRPRSAGCVPHRRWR